MLSIVHLYSKEYGWTREYILDSVYIDEHFLHEKVIKESQQQDLMMKASISMLPHIDEKDRKKFLDNISHVEEEEPRVDTNVSFEETKKQVEEAKRKLQNM